MRVGATPRVLALLVVSRRLVASSDVAGLGDGARLVDRRKDDVADLEVLVRVLEELGPASKGLDLLLTQATEVVGEVRLEAAGDESTRGVTASPACQLASGEPDSHHVVRATLAVDTGVGGDIEHLTADSEVEGLRGVRAVVQRKLRGGEGDELGAEGVAGMPPRLAGIVLDRRRKREVEVANNELREQREEDGEEEEAREDGRAATSFASLAGSLGLLLMLEPVSTALDNRLVGRLVRNTAAIATLSVLIVTFHSRVNDSAETLLSRCRPRTTTLGSFQSVPPMLDLLLTSGEVVVRVSVDVGHGDVEDDKKGPIPTTLFHDFYGCFNAS
jgi:hypothetical protein